MEFLKTIFNNASDFADGLIGNVSAGDITDSFLSGVNTSDTLSSVAGGVEDWLGKAFSGKNLSSTLKGVGTVADAVGAFQSQKADEEWKNKIFALQKQEFDNKLEDREEAKKNRENISTSFSNVWG